MCPEHKAFIKIMVLKILFLASVVGGVLSLMRLIKI